MTDSRSAKVAELVMGRTILTDEEMLEEAKRVWEKQPLCRHFHMGFRAWREKPDGVAYVKQDFPDYLHDEHACHEALEKMREKGWTGCWLFLPITCKSRHTITLSKEGMFPQGATAPTFCEAAVDAMLKAKEDSKG